MGENFRTGVRTSLEKARSAYRTGDWYKFDEIINRDAIELYLAILRQAGTKLGTTAAEDVAALWGLWLHAEMQRYGTDVARMNSLLTPLEEVSLDIFPPQWKAFMLIKRGELKLLLGSYDEPSMVTITDTDAEGDWHIASVLLYERGYRQDMAVALLMQARLCLVGSPQRPRAALQFLGKAWRHLQGNQRDDLLVYMLACTLWAATACRFLERYQPDSWLVRYAHWLAWKIKRRTGEEIEVHAHDSEDLNMQLPYTRLLG